MPVILGSIAFIVVVGFKILNPNNVAWLLADFDMTLEYLGWSFYRHGPWTFPLGLNPNFGLDIGSSIIYSNSLPVFALIFKPLSPFLSEPFQFWGIWILLCFLLQAWFAWILIGLISSSSWIRIFAVGIFIFSPPMLFQIGFHNSTIGHFPILAAFYLILRSKKEHDIFWWTLLLSTTLLIHPYTFAMVFALWLANLLDQGFLKKKLFFKTGIKEVLIVLTTIFLVAWQSGYFMGVSPGESGFGLYRMNALAIFDSSGFDAKNWSYIFNIPQIKNNNNYEGFNYLGLGLLLIFIFAIPVVFIKFEKIKNILSKNLFLAICLFGFAVFSMSNNIGFGSWNFTIPLPNTILSLASILRASGRMFWPVFYAIGFASIYLLIRGYPKKIAIVVLGIAFLLQATDTSSGWLQIKQKINSPSTQLEVPLSNAFWSSAAKHYQKVVRVPVWNEQAIWEKFASYAGQHHLATNAVFMGRVDKDKITISNQKTLSLIKSQQFDPLTLYIIEDSHVPLFLENMNSDKDLLARFDEINIFAPGWKNCKLCIQIQNDAEIDPQVSPSRLIKIGERIDLSRFGKYATIFLNSGWSVPENWGAWSDKKIALIILPLPAKTPKILQIQAQAFINEKHPTQEIEIWINGKFQKREFLTKRQANVIDIAISKEMMSQTALKVEFKFPDAISPKDMGVGYDARALAMGIESLTYY